MWYIFLFRCNNGCTNAPHCYIIHTLALFFNFTLSRTYSSRYFSREFQTHFFINSTLLLSYQNVTLTKRPINSMEHNPSSEANGSPPSQTIRLNTVFTRDHHLSLSWTRGIQPMPLQPIPWISILILSSYLSLGFPSDQSAVYIIYNFNPWKEENHADIHLALVLWMQGKKTVVFWSMTPCGFVSGYWHFRGICRLHHQNRWK
jgi:hypothetical protein